MFLNSLRSCWSELLAMGVGLGMGGQREGDAAARVKGAKRDLCARRKLFWIIMNGRRENVGLESGWSCQRDGRLAWLAKDCYKS